MKKSYINPVSKKQAKINKTQAEIKSELMAEQIEIAGYNFCQTCRRGLRTWELEAAHVIAKSNGGKTSKENIVLEGNAFGCNCHSLYEKRPETRPVDSIGYLKWKKQTEG